MILPCRPVCTGAPATLARIRTQRSSAFLTAVLCVLLHAASAAGQGQIFGEVRGTIKDEQGGVLVGVVVSAMPVDDRPPLTTTTDAAGFYSIADVPPGEYSIKAELQAFTTIVQPGVVARAGLSLSLDLTMSIGGVGEAVTVRRDTPLLETKSAISALNVGGDLQRALPLSGARDWADAARLAPGVISAQSTEATTYSLHGSYPGVHVLQVDGADLTAASIATNAYIRFSNEAVGDVQIKTGGLDASSPIGLGVVINMTTPSGTNRLAGAAGVAVQPLRWNASNTTGGSSTQVGLIQPDFSLGGPIRRDRWWFFGTYRRTQQTVGLSRTAAQIAALEALSPGFTPFDNETNGNAVFGKSTSQLSANHHLMVFAQRDVTPQDANDGTYAGKYLRYEQGGSAYAARLSSVFGPSTTSRVEVSYNDKAQPILVNYDDRPGRRIYQNGFISSGVLVGNGLLATLDNYPGLSFPSTGDKLTIAADVTHLRQGWAGSHEMQAGVYLQPWVRRRSLALAPNNGYVVEDSVLKNASDPAAGVVPFHRQVYQTTTFPNTSMDSRDYAFYVQDVWRPASRLTLTAGVRVDLIRQVDRTLDVPVQDSADIGPRFGVNYLLTPDGHNTVRASWTRVHDTMQSTNVTAGTTAGGLTDSYDNNLDGIFETSLVVPAVTRVNPNRTFDIDNWHQPYVNEWTVGYRRQLPGLVSIDASWTGREYRDRGAGIEVNGIYDGGVFQGYRNVDLNQVYLVTNNTWNWPVYNALSLQVTKQTARLQIVGSYTRQWRHLAGTWQPNDPAAFIQPEAFSVNNGIGPTRGNAGTATDANSLSGTQGTTSAVAPWRDHAASLGVNYSGPWGLLFATSYTFQSGVWSGPVVTRLAAADPQFGPGTITLSNGRVVQNPLATTIRFLGPTRSDGQFTLPNLHILNLRIGRDTAILGGRLTTAIDFFNVTNHDADQAFLSGANQLYNPSYGLGRDRQLPRAVQLSCRFTF